MTTPHEDMPVPMQPGKKGPEGTAGEVLACARPLEPWPPPRRAANLRRIEERIAAPPGLSRTWVEAVAAVLLVLGGVFLSQWAGGRDAPLSARASVANDAPRATARTWPRGEMVLPAGAPGWSLLSLDGVGLVEATAQAVSVAEEAQEIRLVLTGGTLRAHIQDQPRERPVVVVTPELRTVVVGTRFDVHSYGGLTEVQVLHGRVRVDSGGPEIELGAGESIRSDDARLHPSSRPAAVSTPPATALAPEHPVRRAATLPSAARRAPARTPAGPDDARKREKTVEACRRHGALDSRKACLERVVAQGGALAAENALHLLAKLARDIEGRPDEALAHWREHQRRFPFGALAPETALAIFETLLAQGKPEEASAAAEAFLRRFETDPRAPEVALAQAGILCATASRRAEGMVLLERFAGRAPPQLEEAARLALLRCREGGASAAPPEHRPAPGD